MAGIGDEIGAHALDAFLLRDVGERDDDGNTAFGRDREALDNSLEIFHERFAEMEFDFLAVQIFDHGGNGVHQRFARDDVAQMAVGEVLAENIAGGAVGAHDHFAVVGHDENIRQRIDQDFAFGDDGFHLLALIFPGLLQAVERAGEFADVT